jgi:RND family efflux transporter MFP subunit
MKILDLPVKVGDKVKKGQLLAKLDTSEAKQELESERLILQQKMLGIEKLKTAGEAASFTKYENDIESSRIKMENARKEYENLKELYELGAEAEVNVTDAKTEYEKAQLDYKGFQQDYQKAIKEQKGKDKDNETDIKSAQLDIELEKKKIEKLEKQVAMSTITAPSNGTIIELNFKEGATADSTKPIYKLADTKKGFEFVATVDSDAAKKLSTGDEAEISLESLEGYDIQGKVSSIVDNEENIGTKKNLIIDIPSENITGGENGSVTIKKNSKTYEVIIPSSALGQDTTGYFVYVVKAKEGPLGTEYIAQRVTVLIGESDNSKTGITSGLSSSDKVITAKDKELSEGMKVTVAQEDKG